MGRGLDQQEESPAILRQNPFRQAISEINEEEIDQKKREAEAKAKEIKQEREASDRVEQLLEEEIDVERLKGDGWSDEEIEAEKERLRISLAKKLKEEAFKKVEDRVLGRKIKQAEELIDKRRDYLLSQGFEDLGQDRQGFLAERFALLRDEYEVQILPVGDSYLEERGQKYVFGIRYSKETALIDTRNSRGQWENMSFATQSLNESEVEEQIDEKLQESMRIMRGDNGVLFKDFAASEEEARQKAEEVIAKNMAASLDEAQKLQQDFLQKREQARLQQEEEERKREKKSRPSKSSKKEKKK